MAGKVVVIGLDGASFNFLVPLMNEGHLPNLQSFMVNCSRGSLRSTLPPVSAPAWASFMTGKNPGKHGVFSFFQKSLEENEENLIDSTKVHGAKLWDIASAYDRSVGIINCPLTYPPLPVNGFLVSGMLTPKHTSTFTYPSNLRTKIGGYRIDIKLGKRHGLGLHTASIRKQQLLEEIKEITEIRGKTAVKLLEEYNPDLFVVVFTGLDRVLHFFWDVLESKEDDCWKKLLEYFHVLDSTIGKLLQKISDERNIIFVSDHGFGPAEKKEIDLNAILKMLGHLNYPFNQRVKSTVIQGVIPILDKIKLLTFVKRLISQQGRKTLRPRFNHSNTRAFFERLYPPAGGVRLNVKGRELHGLVEPGKQYKEIRESLIIALKEFQEPGRNRKLFLNVHRKEELYKGDYLGQVPDIICIARDGYGFRSLGTNEKRTVLTRVPTKITGNHRMEGILAAKGPSIKEGIKIEGSKLEDVTPTILYLMGLPSLQEMDGKVLTEVITEKFLSKNSPRLIEQSSLDLDFEHRWSEQEQDEIKERLENLGYL